MSMYVGLGFLTMLTFDLVYSNINFNMPIWMRLLVVILWPLFLLLFLYQVFKD
jgi:uncharacterized protein (DUF983 family)